MSGWPRRAVIVAMAASVLLPVEASRANFLTDLFKGSSKQAKPSKSASRPKREAIAKAAAPARHVASSKPAAPPKSRVAEKPDPVLPAGQKCEPAKFHLVIDVGHTAESDGAMSARNVPEFRFNLNLAERIKEKLTSEGFVRTQLMVTEGKARPSLIKRAAKANKSHADLFLSIHHDSVPDKFMENWEFEGKESHFSDRFSGYSLFVSRDNPDYEASLAFATMIGKELKADGLKFANQYTLPIMGKYQHPLLDKDAGVYRYDHLVVLKRTLMPAVLLEAGSIINRDEELQMASVERQDMIIGAVTTAVKEYCGPVPASEAEARPQVNANH